MEKVCCQEHHLVLAIVFGLLSQPVFPPNFLLFLGSWLYEDQFSVYGYSVHENGYRVLALEGDADVGPPILPGVGVVYDRVDPEVRYLSFHFFWIPPFYIYFLS